jgi:hypothetical protein
MRRLVPCLAAALTLVVGTASGGVSLAQDADLALTPSTAPAGTGFQAVLTGCPASEMVAFVIEETDLEAVTAPCTGPGPSASATLVAPTLGGQWTVTATASMSGTTASAILNVTGGEENPDDLPPTGPVSEPIAWIGAALLAIGAALTLVHRVRRTEAVNTSELR